MSENPEKSPEGFNPGNQEGAPQNTGFPPPYEPAAYPQPVAGGAYPPPGQAPYYQPPAGAYQPPPPGAYQQPPPGGYQKQNMPQGQVVQGGMVRTNQPGPVVMTGQPGYPHTQTVVVTSGMGAYAPPDYLIFSILTILCCWPIAIVAIIFSCGSRSAARRGDHTTALSKGQTAKTLCIAALVCGIVLIILNVVLRIVLFSAS